MDFIIESLSKKFETKEVLKNINFSFESGKIYGLLGRNGAGKTTLFNCVNRDIKSDSGSFYLMENGSKRETLPEDIGYVLSTPTVPEFLTAREFLKFFIEINESSIQELRSTDEYFEMVNIEPGDRDRLLKDFSHGMKNKMQMLINLIAKPNILLLDEPLTSLDVVVAEEMKQLLKQQKEGRIIIFSTHIMELALDLCDVRLMLEPEIAVLACEHATEEEKQELKRLCDEVEELYLAGENHLQKDVEFHTWIARCSKNRVIEKLLPIIQSAVITFVNLTHRQLKKETIQTHRAITDAILRGDSAGAKYAMMMHLNYNRQMILEKQGEALNESVVENK